MSNTPTYFTTVDLSIKTTMMVSSKFKWTNQSEIDGKNIYGQIYYILRLQCWNIFISRKIEATINENIGDEDRKSTRLNSSHTVISYAVFCLKKKNKI